MDQGCDDYIEDGELILPSGVYAYIEKGIIYCFNEEDALRDYNYLTGNKFKEGGWIRKVGDDIINPTKVEDDTLSDIERTYPVPLTSLSQHNSLDSLPNEMLFNIAIHTDVEDMNNLCSTNTRFRELCHSPYFWKEWEKQSNHSFEGIMRYIYSPSILRAILKAGANPEVLYDHEIAEDVYFHSQFDDESTSYDLSKRIIIKQLDNLKKLNLIDDQKENLYRLIDISSDDIEMMSYLIDNFKDQVQYVIDYKDSIFGSGDKKLIKMMKQKGIDFTNAYLVRHIGYDEEDVVEWLLDAGADPTADTHGQSAVNYILTNPDVWGGYMIDFIDNGYQPTLQELRIMLQQPDWNEWMVDYIRNKGLLFAKYITEINGVDRIPDEDIDGFIDESFDIPSSYSQTYQEAINDLKNNRIEEAKTKLGQIIGCISNQSEMTEEEEDWILGIGDAFSNYTDLFEV